MKLAGASLYTRKYVESTFNRCGSPVKLVHGCLSVRKDLDSSFHQCGGHVKHVQARWNDRNVRESSFDSVELRRNLCTPLSVPVKLRKADFTTGMSYEVRVC